MSKFEISKYDPQSPSASIYMKEIHNIYQNTWGKFNPAYKLPFEKFKDMLEVPSAAVFIAIPSPSKQHSSVPKSTSASREGEGGKDEDENIIWGFVVTYLIRNGASDDPKNQHLKGGLSLIQSHPSHLTSGSTKSLHSTAIQYLEEQIRNSLSLSTPKPEKGSIMLGSVFPRFTPGLPWEEGNAICLSAKQFFENLGWKFNEELNYDMYRTLPIDKEGIEKLEKDLKGLMSKAESHGISFGPFNGDSEGLHELQQEFLGATGWPDAVMRLSKDHEGQNVHCGYDKDGKIVAATLSALPPLASGEDNLLAYPSILGKRCGIIACVGVHASQRGTGIGQGLVASATISLAKRGADGCFIDWLRPSLVEFYGLSGFKTWEMPYLTAQRDVDP